MPTQPAVAGDLSFALPPVALGQAPEPPRWVAWHIKSMFMKPLIFAIVSFALLTSGCNIATSESIPTQVLTITPAPIITPGIVRPTNTMLPSTDIGATPTASAKEFTQIDQSSHVVHNLPADGVMPIEGRILAYSVSESQHQQSVVELSRSDFRAIGTIAGTQFGPRLRLSPGGQWILFTRTWNPLEGEASPGAFVIASDASRSFTVPWKASWDITLGWWDDRHIVILPANGKTSDIVLLDILSLTTTPVPSIQGAINREFGRTYWSPWREKDGVTVFFNHRFTQALYFDAKRFLILGDTAQPNPLWSFGADSLTAFFTDNGDLAQWSPDDNFVAFPAWDDHVQEVYILNQQGFLTQTTHLAKEITGEARMYIQGWSPNNRLLAVKLVRKQAGIQTVAVMLVDLEKRELRIMPTNDFTSLIWSPDSTFVAYSAASGAIAVADVHSGETWAMKSTPSLLLGWLP